MIEELDVVAHFFTEGGGEAGISSTFFLILSALETVTTFTPQRLAACVAKSKISRPGFCPTSMGRVNQIQKTFRCT